MLKHAGCLGELRKLTSPALRGLYQCQKCKELVKIGTHISRDRQGYIQKQRNKR